MLKFAIKGKDKNIFACIGLSEVDIKALMEKKPIVLDLNLLHPKLDNKVLIFYGETDEQMEQYLTEVKLLPKAIGLIKEQKE